MEECAWGPLTLGSPGTGAFVGIDQVNAGAPVLARLGETFIDLVGAVGPHISWHALRGKRQRSRKKRRQREEKEGKKAEGRERGKVESMSDMKQRWFLFTWLFSGLHPAKASRSFIPGEINSTNLFVFYL